MNHHLTSPVHKAICRSAWDRIPARESLRRKLLDVVVLRPDRTVSTYATLLGENRKAVSSAMSGLLLDLKLVQKHPDDEELTRNYRIRVSEALGPPKHVPLAKPETGFSLAVKAGILRRLEDPSPQTGPQVAPNTLRAAVENLRRREAHAAQELARHEELIRTFEQEIVNLQKDIEECRQASEDQRSALIQIVSALETLTPLADTEQRNAE